MFNQATIIGYLGRDPEIRSMQSGGMVASFSVATSETWKDKRSGERKVRTEWHRVVVFGDGLVGVVEKYAKKGSHVCIQGRLQTRKWTKDNVERSTTEIVVHGRSGSVQLLGWPSADDRDVPPPAEAPQADLDDEIPF